MTPKAGTASFPPFRSGLARALCAAGLVGLLLSGCASNRTNVPQEARIVTPSESVILPPPGGPALVKVTTTSFPNAIRQDVWLETTARSTGENKISVIRFTDKGGDGSDARLRDIPFTNVNLTEEALAAWPGSGMAVSPFYVQNDYGPFGYAIGKPANGDTCIYAWQRIDPMLKPSGAVDRGAIVIRLQMCRQRSTEQQLLEVMYRLRLNTAVFPPNKAPALIGRNSAPIRPIGVEGFAEVIPINVAPRSTSPVKAVATKPVAAPLPAGTPLVPSPGTPAAGTVIVPSPSTSTSTSTTGPVVPRPPSSGTSTSTGQ